MVGRKAFRSKDGMLGLCPLAAREGDSIVVASGANSILALRKIEPAEQVSSGSEWRCQQQPGQCFFNKSRVETRRGVLCPRNDGWRCARDCKSETDFHNTV